MPTLIVEEDRVLRLVQIMLDPGTPAERTSAYADYMAHDVDLIAWRDALRARIPGLYPAKVHLVTNADELHRALPSAEVVIVESLELGQRELAAAPKLKWVQTFGAFAPHIDADACRARNLPVHTVRRRTNRVVAEHTMLLMLALAKRFPLINGLVTRGRLAAAGFASRPYDTRHTPGANFARIPGLRALAGSALGLLGFGEIAREVAAMARPFGMEILYHKRARFTAEEEREAGATYCSFEELFARSDYLSIHVPSSAQTRDLVDAAALRRMKSGAFLINTSRAAIVNREALLDAVAGGHLGGVGLDVLYEEPAADDEPLLNYANVIVTPHLAGASRMNGLADLNDMLISIWQGIRGR
jgi:phosphoglycerate dehydrogenase-like enzyme